MTTCSPSTAPPPPDADDTLIDSLRKLPVPQRVREFEKTVARRILRRPWTDDEQPAERDGSPDPGKR